MKMKKLSIALLCAMMTTGAAFAQTAADASAKYNEAGELLGAKNYAGAIEALESSIEMGLAAGDAIETVQSAQKLLPQCYYSEAMRCASQKDFDTAADYFTKAAELGELYGEVDIMSRAKSMLSRVYMAQGGDAFNSEDWATAISVFSKGYAANANDTAIGLLLAKSYAESGDMESATEVYTSIMALEARNSRFAPDAEKARTELSTYLLIQAQEAAAANDFDGVIEKTGAILEFDEANAAATMMRIQTATNLSNFDAVIEYGDQAIETQADDESKSNAYFLVGAAYQNKENTAKAIEMYRQVTAGANVDTAKAQITALSK